MILTVTLNTALDITYRTPALVPHTTHRVGEVVERPGGKGLNVARVLAALGHETVVTGFAGGRTGDVLRELLATTPLSARPGAGGGPGHGGPGGHGTHDGPGGPGSRPGRGVPRSGTGGTGPLPRHGPAEGPRARPGHGPGAAPGAPGAGESGAGRPGGSPAHRPGGRYGHRPGPGAERRYGAGPGHGATRPVDALVPIAGSTRRTIAVVDGTSGDTTQFNEPGPTVSPAEWNTFLRMYERLLTGAGAVALCGSLPPGIHVGAYAELIRRARSAGVPVLLDTSGEPLRRGVAARPDLVKPNAAELAGLTGSREPLDAAQDARRRGAHAVVASLGPDGVLAATPDGVWRAAPPVPVRGNPTGAGDSAVAGLLSGLVERLPWPARLSRAVALATATVLAPAAGEFDTGAYEELLPRVTVTERPPA